MNDYTLSCNIEKCRTPLSDVAWVTRCLHVFCPRHGQAYFSNTSPQVHCPFCNEVNVKEVDILLCELNPSDMILAGMPPMNAISLASKSLKLWWTQIQEEQRLCLSKANLLDKKNNEMKYIYNKTLNKMKQKHQLELNSIKTYCNAQIKKIEELTCELRITREKLQSYKKAVFSMRQPHRPTTSASPHWFSSIDDIPISPASVHSAGSHFSIFNENQFFK